LKAKIETTFDRAELEDLYLPYRPKRRTKATIARDKGLEPLADYLWNQQVAAQSLHEFAASFVNAEKEVASIDDALEGARHIVAERISRTPSCASSLATSCTKRSSFKAASASTPSTSKKNSRYTTSIASR